jgi:hypothetical protein
MKKILLTTAIISLIISAVPATGQYNGDMSNVDCTTVVTIAKLEGRIFHKKQPGLDATQLARKLGLAHNLRDYMLRLYSATFEGAYETP